MQTRADMCVAEGGAVATWSFLPTQTHINTHTHTHTRAHVCGVSREPRPWSVCAHTYVCCKSNESVVAPPVAWIVSDCTHAQPPVCCRSKWLRPRCRERCFCDLRTCVVAQRCASVSRNLDHGCRLWELSKRCVDTQTRVWRCHDRVWKEQKARGQLCTHTHVFFRSTKSGVTGAVCGVCQRSHDPRTHTCAADACAARTWAHVISHTCAVSREPRPWSVSAHRHVCCRSKESVVALPVAWIAF